MPGNDPLYEKAIAELAQLFDEVRRRGDEGAAALATAAIDARPSVRMISIARIAATGVCFFADSRTGKGQQLQVNPHAALCFHWPGLHYQAIVEGPVETLDEAVSNQLWRGMPRDYALGHWASQAGTETSLEDLRRDLGSYRNQFNAERVPLPPAWRAYEVKPERIALWPAGWRNVRLCREFRAQADGHWTESQLNP